MMSTQKKLISLGAAAALSLGLAACGGGGGPKVAPQPTPKTVDLTGLTSGWMLGAAGKLEIKAGASKDSGDVTFTCASGDDDCVVTVSATGATATGGDVTASDSQAFKTRLASELAEAKLVAAATEPGSARADANNDPLDGNQLPFTIDGGTATTTTPDDNSNNLRKSSEKPAAITGWTGSIHTRKTAADTTQNPAVPAKDDMVVSYTDRTGSGDADYIDFGYWLETATASDGTKSHKALAFGKGNRDYGAVEQVVGKASYAGKATGLYVKKMLFDTTSGALLRAISGQFTADAALQAVFGGPSIAPDDAFKIKGAVTNFRDAGGNAIDSAWTVDLKETGIGAASDQSNGYTGDSGTVSGTTTGGGAWTGTFHGDPGDNNAQPAGVSGTFDGHFTNGHVYGAYGTNRQ